MAGRVRTRRLNYIGEQSDHDILISSYGHAVIKVAGTFDLSGIIYCPKYSVTLSIQGHGKIVFRGICHSIVIKRMSGGSTLDLSQLVSKEMECREIKDQSIIVAGRTRSITHAALYDKAVLYLSEKPLILNPVLSNNARVELVSNAALQVPV
jgi:hypothetical protein